MVEVLSSSGPLVRLRGAISFFEDPEGSSFDSFAFFPEMSLSELLSDSEMGVKTPREEVHDLKINEVPTLNNN